MKEENHHETFQQLEKSSRSRNGSTDAYRQFYHAGHGTRTSWQQTSQQQNVLHVPSQKPQQQNKLLQILLVSWNHSQ